MGLCKEQSQLSLPDLVCDSICQPSNEDENEMKINSHYQTDPYLFLNQFSLSNLQDSTIKIGHCKGKEGDKAGDVRLQKKMKWKNIQSISKNEILLCGCKKNK